MCRRPYLISLFFPHHLRLPCPQLTSPTIQALITESRWLFLVPRSPPDPCPPCSWASQPHHPDGGRGPATHGAPVLQGPHGGSHIRDNPARPGPHGDGHGRPRVGSRRPMCAASLAVTPVCCFSGCCSSHTQKLHTGASVFLPVESWGGGAMRGLQEAGVHPDCPAESRVRGQASSLPSNSTNLSRLLALWV